MNNLTEIRKVKSDKKVIAFYIFLALIPFFSELIRLVVESFNPESIAASIIARVEYATETICLIPAYIFVAPLGLLFTLVPLVFIKIARAIFIKDKRYSYAAIGAVFCYNIFIKNFIGEIRYAVCGLFQPAEYDYIHIENITNIVTLIIAPAFICLLFYLSQIIIRPDTGKKYVFKHIFLGITITAAPVIIFLTNYIADVLTYALYDILQAYIVDTIYWLLSALIPVIFAVWVLFMSTVVFRDLRAGLIAVACYSIPFTIAISLMSIASDLAWSLIDDYDIYSIVQAVSSIVLLLIATAVAFLYYLLKILLPYIKMRKKALANKIPDSISDSLSEEDSPEYNYYDGYAQYYDDGYAQYYDDRTQYLDEQTQYFDEQTQYFDDQPQYNNR